MWACGAAGSALPWHGRGRRFDPDQVHQNSPFRRFRPHPSRQREASPRSVTAVNAITEISIQGRILVRPACHFSSVSAHAGFHRNPKGGPNSYATTIEILALRTNRSGHSRAGRFFDVQRSAAAARRRRRMPAPHRARRPPAARSHRASWLSQ
jgi:hypothetical protein